MTVTKEQIENTIAKYDKKEIAEKKGQQARTVYIESKGKEYPAKFIYEHATGIKAADFNTQQAEAELKKLGYEILRKDKAKSDEVISDRLPHDIYKINMMDFSDEEVYGLIETNKIALKRTSNSINLEEYQKDIAAFFQMKTNDRFYLCSKENNLLLIGIVKSDLIEDGDSYSREFSSSWKRLDPGTKFRHPTYKNSTINSSMWPGSVSRCKKLKNTNQFSFEEFESYLLKPYFNVNLKQFLSDKPGEHENINNGGEKVKYLHEYSDAVINSKNVIFHGAPGTGKTFMAKQIAADIITNGRTIKYEELDDEEKKQIGFVQFHPSYDYTDFVEGIRPVNDDGQQNNEMGFELRAGTFKQFVDRARKNYEESNKTGEQLGVEENVQKAFDDFFSGVESNDFEDEFKTIRNSSFKITGWNDRHIQISIESNPKMNAISIRRDEICKMLESDTDFSLVSDVHKFFNRTGLHMQDSYVFAIYKEIKELLNAKSTEKAIKPELK